MSQGPTHASTVSSCTPLALLLRLAPSTFSPLWAIHTPTPPPPPPPHFPHRPQLVIFEHFGASVQHILKHCKDETCGDNGWKLPILGHRSESKSQYYFSCFVFFGATFTLSVNEQIISALGCSPRDWENDGTAMLRYSQCILYVVNTHPSSLYIHIQQRGHFRLYRNLQLIFEYPSPCHLSMYRAWSLLHPSELWQKCLFRPCWVECPVLKGILFCSCSWVSVLSFRFQGNCLGWGYGSGCVWGHRAKTDSGMCISHDAINHQHQH